MPGGEKYLAFDLGAESGRAMLGTFAGDRVTLTEVHRFANGPVRLLEGLCWNPLRLWEEIQRALALAAANHGRMLSGIGLATWGADFALLDQRGALLGLPYYYRDGRTQGIVGELSLSVPEWELYTLTGLPFLPITTLCQLLAMRRQASPALDVASALLMMPSLFTFWLCGRQVAEPTIAGTSQLHSLTARDWCLPLLERLGLPAKLLPEIVPTATVLGPLLPSVASQVGLGAVPVVATASHDTAAAVAAVPSEGERFTFVSSGTWSIIGTELDEPLVTKQALTRRFLNEIGPCGRIFFAYNSAGLWPLQECRREWQRQGHAWSYTDLTEMAAQGPPLAYLVNPDDPLLARSGDMTTNVAESCRHTSQGIPMDPGSVVRSLLEGLALGYRRALDELAELTGEPTRAIHIVGGGARNYLLCQFTADATGCPVLAGPAEATALGNILLQAMAQGRLSSLAEVRQVARRSCELVSYTPHPSSRWDDAYSVFRGMRQS
jgi:rhamnulokinase